MKPDRKELLFESCLGSTAGVKFRVETEPAKHPTEGDS